MATNSLRPVPDYGQHFAQLASRYDSLRREATDDVADWLVACGEVRPGHELVDVGCGTGAMAALLAARAGVTAVGVDASAEMLEVANSRASDRCRFVRGRAEALPFPSTSFDRALMQTVVHLLDRRLAFAEARRVLRDPAALLICTVDPDGIDAFWLAQWFPSWADIDRRRFPAVTGLARELAEAGFQRVETSRNPRPLRFTRDRALSMLRERFVSSFALLDEHEYERGLSRAEREMPDSFESVLQLVGITAWL
jgi:SAM-dependent methyltransferase